MARTLHIARSILLAPVALLAISAAGITGCASGPPLAVVPEVDLGRYMGLWYEIARYPVSFQKGCVAVTAEYSLNRDGTVKVRNACRKGTLDGPPKSIDGTARVPDPAVPAKLKVRFFWFFEGDYWIIDLGKNYQYAAVGTPRRSMLWVLSREPQMDERLYQEIVSRLAAKGFDPGRLVRTPQPTKDK